MKKLDNTLYHLSIKLLTSGWAPVAHTCNPVIVTKQEAEIRRIAV
jgi:hypothetical protein